MIFSFFLSFFPPSFLPCPLLFFATEAAPLKPLLFFATEAAPLKEDSDEIMKSRVVCQVEAAVCWMKKGANVSFYFI